MQTQSWVRVPWIYVLAGLAIVAVQAIGQYRIDTRALAARRHSGAVTSVHYGYTNTFRGNSALLPSEHRNKYRGAGHLPSEIRYEHFASGVLPSERRNVYATPSSSYAFRSTALGRAGYSTTGTIRYGVIPVSTSAYRRPPLARTMPRPTTMPYVPPTLPSTHVRLKPRAAYGTIRYGTTAATVAQKLASKSFTAPQQPMPATATYAPSAGASKKHTFGGHLQGSIRYGSAARTRKGKVTPGFVPKM